jgi:hypothetical protein
VVLVEQPGQDGSPLDRAVHVDYVLVDQSAESVAAQAADAAGPGLIVSGRTAAEFQAKSRRRTR